MRPSLWLYVLALGSWVHCEPRGKNGRVGFSRYAKGVTENKKKVAEVDQVSQNEARSKGEELVKLYSEVLHHLRIAKLQIQQQWQKITQQTKLSFISGLTAVTQGIQFMADIVTIMSSGFWKWMKQLG